MTLVQPMLDEVRLSNIGVALSAEDVRREEGAATGTFPSHRISYRNPEMVSAYLARYPEIEDFLKAAWPVLVRCFGGPVNIVLEVMPYPEETAYEELVGWIQSTDDVYEGLEKLERFEDEWLLDHLAKVGNKFSFNIEDCRKSRSVSLGAACASEVACYNVFRPL